MGDGLRLRPTLRWKTLPFVDRGRYLHAGESGDRSLSEPARRRRGACAEPVEARTWCTEGTVLGQRHEFTGQMMDLWAYRNGVKIDLSRPGKPTDNAFCESFSGTFRAECLDTNWFQTLTEAKHIIEQWRQEYNVSRPHRGLGDRTPAEFASQIALKRDLTETKTGRELTL